MNTQVAIIGGGPAGITAGIYAARAGLKVVICEKNIYGGQTSIIDSIENYPGIAKISGVDFSNALYEQCTCFGVEFVFGDVIKAELKNDKKILYLSDGKSIEAKAVIIANGLQRRTLGCKGEKEFFGKGVSYCATCDGAFFKGKKVAVVGGGNTALEDALYLANICEKVTLIVRKNYFRGEKYLVEAVNKTPNIGVMFESNIKEIKGTKSVESATLSVLGKEDVSLTVDGVFIAIGYKPENEMYANDIDVDENGYFVSGEDCKTKVDGVFVAGDCRKKPLRQIATAVSDGAVCGNSAAKFVFGSEF